MDPGFRRGDGLSLVSMAYVAAAGVTSADEFIIPVLYPPSFRRKPESILGQKGMDPGAALQPFAGVTIEVVVSVTYVASKVTKAAGGRLWALYTPSFRRKPESILGQKGTAPGERFQPFAGVTACVMFSTAAVSAVVPFSLTPVINESLEIVLVRIIKA
jgi:hypothetical protein